MATTPTTTWQAHLPQSRLSRLPFILAGALLIVAPLSTASDSTVTIKLVRIALAGGVILGLLPKFNQRSIGKITRGLIAFSIFFTLAAVWSHDPLYGLINKSMFLATCLGGIVMGAVINSVADLRRALATLIPFVTIATWVVLFFAFTAPEYHYVLGRLAPFRVNANATGQAAAAMLILSVAYAALERGNLRGLSIFNALGLGYLILETGSRGALAMALIGSLLIIAGKRRGVSRLFMASMFAGIVLAAVLAVSPPETTISDDPSWTIGGTGTSRLNNDLLKDTRTQFWQYGVRAWQSSPIIGVGWYGKNGRSATTMNIYLQVLVETGVVGLTIFAFWLYRILRYSTWLLKTVRPYEDEYRLCAWLSFGCCFGLLIHGIAESSLLLGTTINPLLFGFAVAMLEKIPMMINSAHSQRAAARAVASQNIR